MTQKLFSLRRDAVASVIFSFYILAGSFRSKNRVPSHLPSAMMSRKLLFEAMVELHDHHPEIHLDGTHLDMHALVSDQFSDLGSKKLSKADQTTTGTTPGLHVTSSSTGVGGGSSKGEELGADDANFSAHDKGLWAIVHETAFARTFTEIAEELEKITSYSKFILGEDNLI